MSAWPVPGSGSHPRRWRWLEAPPARALAWLVLSAGLLLVAISTWQWLQLRATNQRIAALANGTDLPVDGDQSPELVFARSHFLSTRGRVDETLPLIARLQERDPDRAADALFNRGNTYLLRGLEFVHGVRVDDAVAQINLAKSDYQQALRQRPDDWEIKYNLDIAMRLVRDFPPVTIEGDDEGEPPERLWTDLPGRPRGMP